MIWMRYSVRLCLYKIIGQSGLLNRLNQTSHMSLFLPLISYHLLFLHWSFFLQLSLFLLFPHNLCIHCAGDVVGALSFSVGHGANTLKKVASVRMFHQPCDIQNIRSYPLTRMVSYHTLHRFYRICPSIIKFL